MTKFYIYLAGCVIAFCFGVYDYHKIKKLGVDTSEVPGMLSMMTLASWFTVALYCVSFFNKKI